MNRRVSGLIVAALALGLLACDVAAPGRVIDAEWHRRSLLDHHLARWLAAAPTPSGLFQGSFDRRWQPKENGPGDLTTQSRLVYAFLVGYEVAGDKRYLEAATRGADFLLERFRDPVHGGFFNRVAADGKVADDAKRSYGHAFALLALSHMYRVSREERFRLAALAAWRDIDRGLRDPLGGFYIQTRRDFSGGGGRRNQNPLMHMFEALLALCEATGDPEALKGAGAVGNFALYRLLQGMPDGSAAIPEWYDEHWQPLSSREKGGYTDLGHQFEWSHLFLKTPEVGLAGVFPDAAGRLLKYAIKVGYDEIEGGAFAKVYPDGTVDRSKYWWEQAECLRALLAAARADDRPELWRRYEQTLDLVRKDFVDPENGGWRFAEKRICEHGGCPDSQPDPYHMAGLHLAAIRAAEGRR